MHRDWGSCGSLGEDWNTKWGAHWAGRRGEAGGGRPEEPSQRRAWQGRGGAEAAASGEPLLPVPLPLPPALAPRTRGPIGLGRASPMEKTAP